MDLVPPTSPSVITVALPRERTNAKKSAMLRPKCHKIKAEFLLMQRCASYMHKKRKGHTVFANVHPQDQGDWVWLALPKHHCNHQSMSVTDSNVLALLFQVPRYDLSWQTTLLAAKY